MDLPSGAEQGERPYISTGHLPDPEMVQSLVSDAHGRFKSNTDGQNSRVYPVLASVSGDLFGLCVVGATGRLGVAISHALAGRGDHVVLTARDPNKLGAMSADERHLTSSYDASGRVLNDCTALGVTP